MSPTTYKRNRVPDHHDKSICTKRYSRSRSGRDCPTGTSSPDLPHSSVRCTHNSVLVRSVFSGSHEPFRLRDPALESTVPAPVIPPVLPSTPRSFLFQVSFTLIQYGFSGSLWSVPETEGGGALPYCGRPSRLVFPCDDCT